MVEPVIKLSKIQKTYWLTRSNKVPALVDINLSINLGEFVALIGPSGSGKSSLLNLLGLLDLPDQGDYILVGKNISKLSRRELAALRRDTLGFIFQTFNLLPRLSALDNVLLPLRYAKVSRRERSARAEELLTLVGLKPRIKHKPPELSGGERQRVAIARALANHPKILLADEPTGNLDSKSGAEIIELLIKLNREQKVTLILVTHDLNLAQRADRIIRIKDGQLC